MSTYGSFYLEQKLSTVTFSRNHFDLKMSINSEAAGTKKEQKNSVFQLRHYRTRISNYGSFYSDHKSCTVNFARDHTDPNFLINDTDRVGLTQKLLATKKNQKSFF